MSETLYRTAATSTGDARNGRSRSVDGLLDVELAIPSELGGAGGKTDPEQLFAAGYAACFHSALRSVAGRQKLRLTDSAVTVEIFMVEQDDGRIGLRAAIEAELLDIDPERGMALLEAAHQVCPYSNATRGNMEVTLALA